MLLSVLDLILRYNYDVVISKEPYGRLNVVIYVILVGQITAIFERNRANDDTSIKFGTLVLQVILIKYARLAN